MSDAAITNLISGVVTVCTLIGGGWALWIKLKESVVAAQKAASEVEMVKITLAEESRKRSEIDKDHTDKLDHVVKQTNGLVERLVRDAKVGEFDRGVKSETDKQEHKNGG